MHCLINNLCRDIPVIPMVKISPSKAGDAFLILVRDLRSHLPQGKKKKKQQHKKKKQYCSKFNKNFKNGPLKKCLKKLCN